MSSLSTDLATYRANIRAKVRDVRGAGRGGSVEKLQSTLDDIKKDMGVRQTPSGTITQPVVVSHDTVAGVSGVQLAGAVRRARSAPPASSSCSCCSCCSSGRIFATA